MNIVDKYVITLTILLAVLLGFKILYGIAYYLIPIIISSFITILYLVDKKYELMNKTWLYESFHKVPVLHIITVFAFMWLITGFLVGFGINIMFVNIIQYLLYAVDSMLLITVIEIIRREIIDNVTYKWRFSILLLASITTTSLYIILQNISVENLNTMLQAIVLFTYNTFLTVVAMKSHFKIHVIVAVIYMFLFNTSPILPILSTRLSYMFQGFTLLITFIVFFAYSSKSYPRLDKPYLKYTGLASRITYALNIVMTILLIIFVIGFFMGYRGLVIVSGSMEPTLSVGDVIIIDLNANNYEKGDIATFTIDHNIVTHRIIEKYRIGKTTYYLTKGDANTDKDPWAIEEKYIIGKYVFKIPYIGYPTVWYSKIVPDRVLGIGLVIVFILLITILYLSRIMVLSVD